MSNELMDEINGRFLDDPRERIDPRSRIDIRAVSEAERVPMGGNRLRLTLPKREGIDSRSGLKVGISAFSPVTGVRSGAE